MGIPTEIWWQFLLCVLATWRLAHLMVREDGPADLIVRVRARLGDSILGSLMDCFYCISVWMALPLTVLLDQGLLASALLWLAMSGAACLLERFSSRPNTPPCGAELETTGEPPCAVETSGPRSLAARIGSSSH